MDPDLGMMDTDERLAVDRAGIIVVVLRTRVLGGVEYARRPLPADDLAAKSPTGAEVKRWETDRVVEDKAEYAAARAAQSTVTSLVARECSQTSFGLMCPASRREQLDEAVRLARAVADEHNRTARTAFVEVRVVRTVMVGEDAAEVEREADEAIELAEAKLAPGPDEKPDVEEARKVLTRAKSLADLLSEGAAARVLEAVQRGRRRATELRAARARAAAAGATGSAGEPSGTTGEGGAP